MLWAVRWYCRYGVSYRDLEQMMGERGVSVDHSTIYRWVQKYAPEIEKRLRWQWRQPSSTSWRVDETYIKVRGQWAYLWRAVDKFGRYDRLLPLINTQRRGGEAVPRQGAERFEELGAAARHQHGQGADLCRGARRVEEGGQMPRRHRPSTGQST